MGCAQLKKLPSFVEVRKKNWNYLRQKLEKVSNKLILPEKTEGADPSWFGFLMMVRDDAGFKRDDITQYLEEKKEFVFRKLY